MAPVRTTDKEPQPTAGSSAGQESRQRRKPGRVPVSCAECRRLKLRCDRQVPCESCNKRGCAAICPDGSLPTTKGPKLKAAAEVEELKDKVVQLEEALRALQSAVSDEPHPLLRDSSPQSATTTSNGGNSSASGDPSSSDNPGSTGGSHPSPDSQSSSTDEDEIIDSFGTLTLGTRGEARFFGQTSRTEYLIHAPERATPLIHTLSLPRLTSMTIEEACKELDVFCTNQSISENVLSCIPTMEDALRLCDIYFECSKFLWYPLPREYVYTEVVAAIYSPPTNDYCHVTRKHALSLMFMIFSLATLFDQNMPPYSAEAQEYYLLAHISLRWAPPAFDTTLAAIQSMIYMGQYMEMSDCEPAHTGSHKAWMKVRHAVTLGYSIGLHVSGGKWNLDDMASAKRGRVFWQLFTQDTWLSFGFGRPPSINLAYVDCDIPEPEEMITMSSGKRWSTGFHVWTWQFTKLLHTIMNVAFAAKTPTYMKIMELDKRVRDFPDPPCLQEESDAPLGSPENTTRSMQVLLVTLYKESTHINLHRPYLSQALKDSHEDPLRHKHGASVMIIYRSAWRILNAVQSAYRTAPGVTARISLLWSQALACSILLCLLITKAPTSNLANPALMELDKICETFEAAANQSQIVTNNIHVLRKLRKQAHAAITKVMTEDAALVTAELDRLGGKTQLIQTLGERRITTCHAGFRESPTVSKEPLSVFEVSSNPNGFIQPTIIQDTNDFDDVVGNPPVLDVEFDFDFLTGSLPFGPAVTVQSPQQSQVPSVDYSQAQNQNVNWLSNYLDAAATAQGVTQPIPSAAEMDASWRVLVDQLGI